MFLARPLLEALLVVDPPAAWPATWPATLASEDSRAIPALDVGPLTEQADEVLLWVLVGAAVVQAAGRDVHVVAGQAVWVPVGVRHRTRTAPGTVVLPFVLPPEDHSGPAVALQAFDVPAGWTGWLLHCWDDTSNTRQAAPLTTRLRQALRLLSPPALTAQATQTTQTTQTRAAVQPAPAQPPMPRSKEALTVAQTLAEHVASPQDLASLAASQRLSVRSLQRQFLRQTGLTFSGWRTRMRISVAARRLTEGAGVGATGREVGFATAAGFTKAFVRSTGLSPTEYARRTGQQKVLCTPVANEEAGADSAPPSTATELHDLDHPGTRTEHRAPPAPGIPGRHSWQQVSDRHELVWVYQGSACLHLGGRDISLSVNQLMWVPAGMVYSASIEAESLLLTVATAPGHITVAASDLRVFHAPPQWRAHLLHCMAREYTLFGACAGPGWAVKALLDAQFPAPAPEGGHGDAALARVAAALHRHPADVRCLAEWATWAGVPVSRLSGAVTAVGGCSFAMWRASIRLASARELLLAGHRAGEVARQVGYADASTFSRAFRRAHGLSPLAYQQRWRL